MNVVSVLRIADSMFSHWRRIFVASAICVSITACASVPQDLSKPTITASDFKLVGGFTLPGESFGESSVNWTEGVIEVHGSSLFVVGNEQEDAIAEFTIPNLQLPASTGAWPQATAPVQNFVRIFPRLDSNPEDLDQIVGMEWYQGNLVVNAVEYYDAPADNRLTTIVVDSAGAMPEARLLGPLAMQGSTRAAGWLSAVPQEWQTRLGCTHISGSSSGGPIIQRYSIGPSAYCINLAQLTRRPERKTMVSTELLGFDMNYPLETDLYNRSLKNTRWTHLSRAVYGFIVPGTSTYLTLGYSGGHLDGIAYKLDSDEGVVCDGYCSINADDYSSYYWLWDVHDLWRVAVGSLITSEVKPYAWGEWKLPAFDNRGRIGGAAYDASKGLLYVSVLDTMKDVTPDRNPPIILAYTIGQ